MRKQKYGGKDDIDQDIDGPTETNAAADELRRQMGM